MSGLVYCNGTTDYIEAYFYVTSTSTSQTGSNYKFQGTFVRGQ